MKKLFTNPAIQITFRINTAFNNRDIVVRDAEYQLSDLGGMFTFNVFPEIVVNSNSVPTIKSKTDTDWVKNKSLPRRSNFKLGMTLNSAMSVASSNNLSYRICSPVWIPCGICIVTVFVPVGVWIFKFCEIVTHVDIYFLLFFVFLFFSCFFFVFFIFSYFFFVFFWIFYPGFFLWILYKWTD